ncbi:MAG: HepT-like ribonuclease domain-containing protein, partial [Anaerolineales bacterium]
MQWIIERGLEIGSSTILDIGNHILAGAYRTAVEEYEEILEKLGEKRVISEDLYKELKGLGG